MTSLGVAQEDQPAERGAGNAGWRGAPIARLIPSVVPREILLQAMVLLAVAIITRIDRIGDPAISADEQFYLLVGDRIWHGALPFVDIWDRKPIGLFLLYALFRPLSQDGIIAYQIAALLFAAATALVLARIARRVAGPVAATVAASLYLVDLPIVGGAGGQSPVFYDLFTVAAALLVVRRLDGEERSFLQRDGCAAMLLTGLAIQVKYTAMFEGMAFGLALLWIFWRTQRAVLPLAGFAMSLICCALLPTALAFGFYALVGHAGAFFTANFVSIFQKSEPANFSETKAFLVPTAISMAPMLFLSVVALVGATIRRPLPPVLGFALVWAAFAFAEFFAIGHYYNHYAIPLLMPAAIIMASLFDWAPFAVAAPSLAIAVLLFTQDGLSWSQMRRNRAEVAVLTHALSPYAREGCIYVNDGPSILYLTTRSCLPTRYPFPSHLADAEEAVATDAKASMVALLARRPSAIVVADRPRISPRNAVTDAILNVELAARYHLDRVLSLPGRDRRNAVIYVRNDLR